MDYEYSSVITRFLTENERLVLSEEKEMPLVIEAKDNCSCEFLQEFLTGNASRLIEDLAKYGAILLRGFAISNDAQFEQAILSIPQFKGIRDAFMSENGRDYVEGQKYVLMTNSVYKTGGTLYLGGFHTENYYSTDVPSYICFCCLEPSKRGGETGIINTAKVYNEMSNDLKERLKKKPYFVSKWLISEVAERYQIPLEKIEAICEQFGLPRIGKGDDRFVLMYKPSVLEHPLTKEKALEINLFELATLNKELRRCFIKDYAGRTWFWHRLFWRLPTFLFNSLEYMAVMFIALFNSPKKSYQIVRNNLLKLKANWKTNQGIDYQKVGSCFDKQDIKDLAKSMRRHYSSCLWQKGDILLVDNKKVMHAGMPGTGSRLIRVMIGNSLKMNYSGTESGCIIAVECSTENIGRCMSSGRIV